MEKIKNGREYLQYVLQCLNDRLAQADAAILEGEKEIEDMHEYYLSLIHILCTFSPCI